MNPKVKNILKYLRMTAILLILYGYLLLVIALLIHRFMYPLSNGFNTTLLSISMVLYIIGIACFILWVGDTEWCKTRGEMMERKHELDNLVELFKHRNEVLGQKAKEHFNINVAELDKDFKDIETKHYVVRRTSKRFK